MANAAIADAHVIDVGGDLEPDKAAMAGSGPAAPHPCKSRAAAGAKYVKIPSQPARLKAIRLSIMVLSSSTQPLSAAALIIEYSPETW